MLQVIERAVDAAIDAGISKFGDKKPNKASLKLPLRDGDVERDDDAYAGAVFVNANSTTPHARWSRPTRSPSLTLHSVYSGFYARVSLSFYAFNSNDNRGIACGLGNIQKNRDGDPLGGGRISAESDFGTPSTAGDDFLN